MKALRSLLQFATIFPLGKPVDLVHFARRIYLYPIAGYFIGGIAALAVWKIGSHSLAAGVALLTVLILSGFHHFDGLVDFGDAIMAHGGRENRIRALTDRNVGAGGVGFGIATSLLAFGALQSCSSPSFAIFISEVCAKAAMAGMTIFGHPFKDGIHRYLNRSTHFWHILPTYLLIIPLVLLPLSPLTLFGVSLVTAAATLTMLTLSTHIFGGVNGDVTGATNEITRACVIIALVILT